MKKCLILMMLVAVGIPMISAQDYDDIYYNPKKQTTNASGKKTVNKKTYIDNIADMDVDTYNRRNQYYTTAIDTIGYGVENGEDFIYTQQIQKYYNPTVVVDNANVLADVLANSYGNVNIVINDYGVGFAPVYNSLCWYPPVYRTSYWGPYWGLNFGWGGWNIGLGYYDPWYAWYPGWGPAWNWGPGWGWGPAWHPVPGRPGGWAWADYRPGGNRPHRPNGGWINSTRPGYNYGHRPNSRPGYNVAGNTNRRPSTNGNSGVRVGGNRRQPGYGVGTTTARPGNSTVVNGHRTNGTVNNRNTNSVNNNRNNNRNNNTINNRNNTTHRNNSGYNTPSRNNSGNRGGSFGGGNRGGSFGGGSRSGSGGHRR